MRRNLLLLLAMGGVLLVVFWLFGGRRPVVQYRGDYPEAAAVLPDEILAKIATSSATSVRLPIIMYHRAEFSPDPKDTMRVKLNTHPSILDRQLARLQKEGYDFLFMREAAQIISGGRVKPGQKIITLTFDDGYEDFYFNVLPLLKKYKARATVYVIADYQDLRGYLSAVQLQELKESGLVEIGAHTLTHPDLKFLPKNKRLSEIAGGKEKLEKLLGRRIVSLAYPYGSFNQQTVEMVKAAGYTSAVSVAPGVRQSGDNLFFLYRLRPGVLDAADIESAFRKY